MIEQSIHVYCQAYCRTDTQNRTQFNAVVVQQEEVDRVGVEPTTSASFF
jgi:hypothetical protein